MSFPLVFIFIVLTGLLDRTDGGNVRCNEFRDSDGSLKFDCGAQANAEELTVQNAYVLWHNPQSRGAGKSIKIRVPNYTIQDKIQSAKKGQDGQSHTKINVELQPPKLFHLAQKENNFDQSHQTYDVNFSYDKLDGKVIHFSDDGRGGEKYSSSVQVSPSSKMSVSLQHSVQSNPTDIIVSFQGSISDMLDQLKPKSAFAQLSRGDKATAVYDALRRNADESQKNVMSFLNSYSRLLPNQVQSLWISNEIFVRGADSSLLQSLATFDEVSRIKVDEIVSLVRPVAIGSIGEGRGALGPEWGIRKIRAPKVWEDLGITGQGVVVGIIDTGARYTHEAIRNNFRGGSHSWYDPHSKSQYPIDDDGHGTHVTGTAVGNMGIGVAPGAQWISCNGLPINGHGSEGSLKLCAQFMACPHDYNGTNPDCTKVPNIVNMSWGVRSNNTEFDDILRVWHAIGIIPVKALGNKGPNCSSGTSPGNSQVEVLDIGATTSADSIASFSSRGPSVLGEIKPQVSAPGENIRSSYHRSDRSYASLSGTSQASPHVAGIIALMISKNRNIYSSTIKNILQSSAVAMSLGSAGEDCRSVLDTEFPNYQFGYGRVDAYEAVSRVP